MHDQAQRHMSLSVVIEKGKWDICPCNSTHAGPMQPVQLFVPFLEPTMAALASLSAGILLMGLLSWSNATSFSMVSSL